MAGHSVLTCVRCHTKKIRCTGAPSCQNCRRAEVQCEVYSRPRRSDNIQALRDARRRIEWLEDELADQLVSECRSIPTGTSLRGLWKHKRGSEPTEAPSAPRGSAQLCEADAEKSTDSSLLVLNATGDVRYLGPSSGVLFANYATALASSCGEAQGRVPRASLTGFRDNVSMRRAEEQKHLSAQEIRLLVQSYKLWVHPLYPLFTSEALENLVALCSPLQLTSDARNHPQDMCLFYLILALGATNYANTTKHICLGVDAKLSDNAASHTGLYSMALQHFQVSVEQRLPNVMFVQALLLICIYGSYGVTGSSQWQLAGLAMRTATEIGLHYAPKDSHASDVEETRSRTFWTAYAMEISLAYNLGRPPSIGAEHITTRLPAGSNDTAFGVLHIKHRQIQSRIVSQVYFGAVSKDMGEGERQGLVASLQAELDEWRLSLQAVCPLNADLPYPLSYWDRLYHGTSFVLHRTSSLCPQPSDQSIERCIRSCGGYLDNVAEFLRASNVPLTWMLVQGVLFAGLTMLVTARTGSRRLTSAAAMPLLLVELPAWLRKCSVCLAIMNERWSEDLLAKLDRQFEALADDTVRVISTSLTSEVAQSSSMGESSPTLLPYQMDSSYMMGADAVTEWTGGASWEYLDPFRQVLGMEGVQTFWDVFARVPDESML